MPEDNAEQTTLGDAIARLEASQLRLQEMILDLLAKQSAVGRGHSASEKTPAGDYSIGSNKWPGLSKLIEEMGEVQQAAGKLIATNGETAHWDGSDLRTRLREELADLAAAITFFIQINGLDTEEFHARRTEKMQTFNLWHGQQQKTAHKE